MRFHKIGICLLSLVLICMPYVKAVESEENNSSSVVSEAIDAVDATIDLADSAKSAVLVDAGTGKILYSKNSDEQLPPASITKIMTMLLLVEAVDKGQVKLTDKVQISEHASKMGGSQIFLKPGEQMSINDLLKGMAIASANDASVAIAEFLGGTEESFVRMMNAKAGELGMRNTHFKNPNGLPIDGHYSSARDIAIMSRELLNHEIITKYTGIYQDYLRQDSEKPFWLVNTNKLVRFYDGADGIKTGFTTDARYCLSATAKRGDMRVIAVVMGEPDSKIRNQEVTQMLDHAFNHFQNYELYPQNALIAEMEIPNSEIQRVEIRAPKRMTMLLKKGAETDDLERRIIWNKLEAPIKVGDSLGKLEIYKDGQLLTHLNLVSAINLPKASLWGMTKVSLKKVLFLS